MKKNFILFLVAIIFATNMLSATDTTSDQKEEMKFPGIFNFSFLTGGGLDAINGKVAETYYNAAYGAPNGAVNGRAVIQAGLKIPVNLYSIRLWGKDEFYIIGRTGDPLGSHVRNRFYSGIDNYLSIDKVMNIGINFESRLQSKTSLSTAVSDVFETRLSPTLDLNGSYPFGLSWGITEAFRFYLIPQNGSGDQFQKLQFDGIYYLGFEFMHFANLPNITGQIYTELDLAVDRFFAENLYPLTDISNKTRVYWLEYYAGINFNIYGFTPSVGFNLTFDTTDTLTYPNGLIFTGIKAGLGYSKDIYSFLITYVGNICTNNTYYTTSFGTNSAQWENHIDAAFSINL